MQYLLPRIVLLVLALGGAVFLFAESKYYERHSALTTDGGSSDVLLWMWIFRSGAALLALGAIALIIFIIKR